MELTQKQSILNDLYVLRSGITVIAAEKRNADRINAEYQQKKFKNYGNFFTKPNGDITFDAAYEEYKINREECISGAKSKISVIRGDRRSILLTIVYFLFSLTVIGCPIGALIKYRMETAYGIMCEVALIVGVLMVVGGIIFVRKVADWEWRWGEIKDEKNLIHKANADLINVERVRPLCIEIEIEKNKIIQQIKTRAREFFSALYNQYNVLIDVRDWQHLDLVIFYFQTGRADTLKEALQQVDRKVQADAIVEEIKVATEKVCEAIQAAAEQIVSSLDNIASKLDTMIYQNDKMIRQGEIQNALLAEVANNTKNLMADVNVIIQ